MKPLHDIRSVARHFEIHGEFLSAEPHGSGHINDTYCAVFDHNGARVRYALQRINHTVFKNPVALMDNIQRVIEHLQRKVAGLPDCTRRALNVILTQDGQNHHRDAEGNYWRAHRFIEGATTYDTVETPEQAFEAARAFGQFQERLADLPPPRLHDTIPDFHHTPKRFEALEQAVAANVVKRADSAGPEIEFALRHKAVVGALLAAGLPERVTHNDTKLNNVMLDDATGEALCVIDLDTVMPGLVLYDFGDMVRTATCRAAEDERDVSKVKMQFPMFEALARGYLASAAGFLTREERQLLACSGKVITFEVGIRFLTDFLSGDTYFKVQRPGHNLDRCRTQFKLVESIVQQEARMNELVEAVAAQEVRSRQRVETASK